MRASETKEFNKPFSFVVDQIKQDPFAKFARAGWGANMYIWYGQMHVDGEKNLIDTLCMRSRDGSVVVGWQPWSPDMLADDWGQVQ